LEEDEEKEEDNTDDFFDEEDYAILKNRHRQQLNRMRQISGEPLIKPTVAIKKWDSVKSIGDITTCFSNAGLIDEMIENDKMLSDEKLALPQSSLISDDNQVQFTRRYSNKDKEEKMDVSQKLHQAMSKLSERIRASDKTRSQINMGFNSSHAISRQRLLQSLDRQTLRRVSTAFQHTTSSSGEPNSPQNREERKGSLRFFENDHKASMTRDDALFILDVLDLDLEE